jgi:hypothetical protein
MFVDEPGRGRPGRGQCDLIEALLEDGLDTSRRRNEAMFNEGVMGDGIMALLGTSIAHEDHAVRACSAFWARRRNGDILRSKSCAEAAQDVAPPL